MQHIPEMDAAYDPAAWHDFGVALVSASAALLGLVFVVVSIHLRAVADDPVLFAGGLGLLIHALGGAYLVAAGVVLGVLSAMLAIWTLFVGLGLEQREG
jgi:hypothetical protein